MEVVKMKIRKSLLLEALMVLGKVVAQTSPEEVVRSVRFIGDGGRLRLVATDGVECVTVSVECEVAEAADFAVEYRALRELIRSTRVARSKLRGSRSNGRNWRLSLERRSKSSFRPRSESCSRWRLRLRTAMVRGSFCGASTFRRRASPRRTGKSFCISRVRSRFRRRLRYRFRLRC